MKKCTAWFLAFALIFSLAGCAPASSSAAPSSSASAAVPKDYAQLLRDARSDEENEYSEIVAGEAGGEPTMPHNPNSIGAQDVQNTASMMLQTLGLDPALLERYALSMSLMNVRAYAVGVFKPAEGKSAEVEQALKGYVAAQQKAFEQYLPDQYEVTKGAVVRTEPSGEVILVMNEDAAATAGKLEKALK